MLHFFKGVKEKIRIYSYVPLLACLGLLSYHYRYLLYKHDMKKNLIGVELTLQFKEQYYMLSHEDIWSAIDRLAQTWLFAFRAGKTSRP